MTAANILAASFTIAFEGLMMLHHPPNGNAHLAVVDEPHHHKPVIYLYHDGNKTEITLQRGDRVTFSNTRPGRVMADNLFRQHVVTLNNYVARGHVHDNVTEKVFRPGVLAYVDLPAGAVTTWHNFGDAVQLTRNGQPEIVCMARFAVLGPVTASNVEIIIDSVSPSPHRDRYSIANGDVVIISNISQDPTSLHFPEYSNLLNQDGLMGAMKILYGGCDKNEESDTVDPIVGNILTKHTPTPNGDCGASSNP